MEIKRIVIDNDKICLKKSFDGWRVIYPYKNEDGTTNWKNILTGGSIWKLLSTIIILSILFGSIAAYKHDIKSYKEITDRLEKNPMEFCSPIMKTTQSNYTVVNISKFNLTKLE